jgi:tellurite resistance protein TehA-like permease
MATGIVSVAARAGGAHALSTVLAAAAAAVYVALLLALAARIALDRDHLRRELREPGATLGFLTLVAASDVLAARAGARWLEIALGCVALAAWFVFGAAAVRAQLGNTGRRARREAVRGSWLLASVATHSLAIVGAHLAASYDASWLLGAAWCWWVLGLVLYVLVAAPLARRAAGGGVELAGDHWIVMGALAIGALAAAGLVRASSEVGWAAGFADVARAGEVAFWVAAGAAIPALVLAEASTWPPAMGSERWSTVFPLGMYATATYALHARTGLGWLDTVAAAFLWIAVAALATVAAAVTRARPRSPRPRSQSPRA